MDITSDQLDKAQVLLEQLVDDINTLLDGYKEEHKDTLVPGIVLALLLQHLVTTYAVVTAEQKKPISNVTDYLKDLIDHAHVTYADVTDLITNPSLPSE